MAIPRFPPAPVAHCRPSGTPSWNNNPPTDPHSVYTPDTLDAASGLHHHVVVQQSPIPAIDPAELRPSKRGYWIAGIIAGLGILIGVAGGVGLFVLAAGSVTPDTRIPLSGTGNATGNVRLTAGQDWAVYATSDASWDVQCTATSGATKAAVTQPGDDFDFTDHGHTWYKVAEVKAPADGTYAFSCTPSQYATDAEGLATAQYFVGDSNSAKSFIGGIFGGFAVLFGVPFIAIVLAVIIGVVTGVRRGNHKKRLLAERYGPPPGYGPAPTG